MGIVAKLKTSPLYTDMTRPLLLVSAFAGLGGMNFGLDNSYWGGLLGLTAFKDHFGQLDPTTGLYTIPAIWQSVGSGTPTAGTIIGCILAAPLGERLGRKKCFMIISVMGTIGVLIQAAAINSYWQILVGRIINSCAMGIICNIVPTYQSEMAPPSIRGACINFYQFWQLFGALLATIINYVCSTRTDQWAYRTVMVVQFVIPVILFIGSFFIPDSPRWLLSKGRVEEATETLMWIRQGTSEGVVLKEMELLQAAIVEQRELHYAATYADCFKGTNLRRTLIAIGVQAFQQLQGASFIINYVVVFLEAIGVPNTYEITMYLYLVNLVSAFLAFYIVDKLGRRPLMGFGAFIEAVCMMIVGGLTGIGNGADTSAKRNGALAALFIWLGVQAFAWGSCVWIVSSEVGTLQLREKTLTLATFFGFGFSLLVTYVNPYMQDAGYGNLQGKVGFVYGGLSFISFLFVVFYLPELKNRSLEELDEMFQAKVSVWRFGGYKATGVGHEITVVEKKHDDMEILDGISEKGVMAADIRPVKEADV